MSSKMSKAVFESCRVALLREQLNMLLDNETTKTMLTTSDRGCFRVNDRANNFREQLCCDRERPR